MNIKSLLLGSAAALVAATGARAADAIVIAEPEPMEYVRICDMYGAGFFYIPGTENCLKIGGYMRYEMRYANDTWADDSTGAGGDYRFWKFARFQLNVDVRNETEWGTLRGYAEGRWDWTSHASNRNVLIDTDGDGQYDTIGTSWGPVNSAYLNQGFIELQQSMGTLRIGKSDTPYARFLGYGSEFGPFDGAYAFNNGGEVSYTFNGGNGFSAIIAAVERNTGLFEPAIEGGVNFTQGWGSIGAIVGYDMPVEEWGAKIVARGNFGIFSVGAHVFYASAAGTVYSVDGASEWSALGHAKVNVTDKLGVTASVQWFDRNHVAGSDRWQIAGGLDYKPVNGLRIRPEVRYTTQVERWEAAIRFDRSF